jgi:hypothetical protein
MANRRQIYEYKGGKCAHCGLSVRDMVERYGTANRMFQLNHVDPGKKHPDYENLIRRTISTEQLDELDKCILLCNECHGIVHAQNISCHLKLTVQVEDKQASQKLTGQVIFDQKEGRARFLTNEPILVVPYLTMVGEKEPRLLFGTQLVCEGLLQELFRGLPKTKKLAVIRYSDSRPMLCARHIKGNRVELELDVSCRLLSAEFCEALGTNAFVWLRNGLALTRDGMVIDHGIVSAELTLAGC